MSYLELIRAEVPRYEELQEQAIAAIPFAPERVLELGMGTGETTRRLIEAYPDAWVIGLDSSPDMVFRAREAYDDVQLARIEDPLPDGPWDLVIGVLSIHHLGAEQKQELFRRVREQSRALVIGDLVKAEVAGNPDRRRTTTTPRPPPTWPSGAAARSPGRPTTWRVVRRRSLHLRASLLPFRDHGRPKEENLQRPARQAARQPQGRQAEPAAAARAATARACHTGSARPAAPTPGARSSPTKSPSRRRPPPTARVAVAPEPPGDGRPRRVRGRAGLRRARRGRPQAAADGIGVRVFGPRGALGLDGVDGVEVVPTTEWIGNDDDPVRRCASARRPRSCAPPARSPRGNAAAMVSHGSTGATMAAATFGLRR